MARDGENCRLRQAILDFSRDNGRRKDGRPTGGRRRRSSGQRCLGVESRECEERVTLREEDRLGGMV